MTTDDPFATPSDIPQGSNVQFGDFEGSLVILYPKGITDTPLKDQRNPGKTKQAYVIDVDVVEGVTEGTQSKMYNQEKAEFPIRHDLTGQSFQDVWALSGFVIGDLRNAPLGKPILTRINTGKRPTKDKPEGWLTYKLDEPTPAEKAKALAFYQAKQANTFATPAQAKQPETVPAAAPMVADDQPPF